jgi:hypothetical protein
MLLLLAVLRPFIMTCFSTSYFLILREFGIETRQICFAKVGSLFPRFYIKFKFGGCIPLIYEGIERFFKLFMSNFKALLTRVLLGCLMLILRTVYNLFLQQDASFALVGSFSGFESLEASSQIFYAENV